MTDTLFPQPSVDGLVIMPGFITEQVESGVVALLQQHAPDRSLQRSTWHFGRRYDYADSLVTRKIDVPPIPDILKTLGNELVRHDAFSEAPTQVICNEYLANMTRKDGIAPHRDRTDCFGPVVATVSLLESWVMRFTRSPDESVEVVLPRLSVAILTGPARFEWLHGIQPRQYDRIAGVRVRRNRRLSATFRTITNGF
jgi:alkylated DNA repair dioxygenase AlkB